MSFTPDEEKARRLRITASDAAAIVRMSPWKTPADIWVQKKHPELVDKSPESPALYWGKQKEPLVLENYAKVTEVVLEGSQQSIANSSHPWMTCTPDGLVKGRKKGVEAKTASGFQSRDWGVEGTDQVPPQYLIQGHHSMMVTGYEEWDIPVLIDSSDFRIYHLFRDKELEQFLFEHEEEFYRRFVLGNEVPTFDWGADIKSLIAKRWPKQEPKSVLSVDANGDNTIRKNLVKLSEARTTIAKCEIEKEEAESVIQSYMKEKETLEWAARSLRITWKTGKTREKVNWKVLAQSLMKFCPEKEAEAQLKKHTEIATGTRAFRYYDKSGNDEE